ncbi:MAG: putative toxin-antitoxin system toxin component, PIN family [Actinobacteria bacterium]|nr:putative toxin-antitoxin system toxin component, PIN family [Actinomycetota bacterium]
MLRVVLDPGVLVSGVLATGGPPAKIVDRWREGEFDLVVSPKLLEELRDVLLRPRFRPFLDESDVEAYVAALRAEGVLVDDPEDPPAVTEDSDDDYLIALAVAAPADLIVSGDSHLTGLVDSPVAILRPREFLDELEAGG